MNAQTAVAATKTEHVPITKAPTLAIVTGVFLETARAVLTSMNARRVCMTAMTKERALTQLDRSCANVKVVTVKMTANVLTWTNVSYYSTTVMPMQVVQTRTDLIAVDVWAGLLEMGHPVRSCQSMLDHSHSKTALSCGPTPQPKVSFCDAYFVFVPQYMSWIGRHKSLQSSSP